MVKVFEGTDKEFYMDGILRDNYDTAKRVIKQDWDMLFIVDGYEGSGKSMIAQQGAFYLDPSFNMSRMSFTPKEFRTAIITSRPYQAVVYDEAYTGLSSRSTMSTINRALVSMLAEIRQKNLFVFVVMPTFFDLDKYVALWRSRALIHVYTGEDFQRGFFSFFNSERKKSLYVNGKKYYSYSNPKANFVGRFVNHYTIDEAEYKKAKNKSLINREKAAVEKEVARELQAQLFVRLQENHVDIPHSLKMKILGMPSSTYFIKLKQFNDNREVY